MIARHDLIQRYSGVREYLDQLIAFAEAAWKELAPDSPLLTQYDYECWMAEILPYQQFSCQRCGTFVSADPFGPGAYMVEPYRRVCGQCYDELTAPARLCNAALPTWQCTRMNTRICAPASSWIPNVDST